RASNVLLVIIAGLVAFDSSSKLVASIASDGIPEFKKRPSVSVNPNVSARLGSPAIYQSSVFSPGFLGSSIALTIYPAPSVGSQLLMLNEVTFGFLLTSVFNASTLFSKDT